MIKNIKEIQQKISKKLDEQEGKLRYKLVAHNTIFPDIIFQEIAFIRKKKSMIKLGGIKSETAVDAIIGMLKDPYKDIRICAISILQKIGSERAINAMISMVKDANREVGWNAIKALEETILFQSIKTKTIGPLAAIKESLCQKKLEESVSSILVKLEHFLLNSGDDYYLIEKSFKALDEKYSKEEVDWLVIELEHFLLFIKELYAKELLDEKYSEKEQLEKKIDSILATLSTGGEHEKIKAIQALGKTSLHKSVASLLAILDGPFNYEIHRSTIIALGEIGSSASVDRLIRTPHITSDVVIALTKILVKNRHENDVVDKCCKRINRSLNDLTVSDIIKIHEMLSNLLLKYERDKAIILLTNDALLKRSYDANKVAPTSSLPLQIALGIAKMVSGEAKSMEM